MPYTFREAEEKKTGAVNFLFGFLMIFYILSLFLIWQAAKAVLFLSFFRGTVPSPTGVHLMEFAVISMISVLGAFIHWKISTAGMIEKVALAAGARPPDMDDEYHRRFVHIVEEVAVASGRIRIEPFLIPSHSLNAVSVADTGGRAAIGVTEGLLAALDRAQLTAVVGHEAAHIISGDSLANSIACSLFGVYAAMLSGVGRGLKAVSSTGRGKGAGSAIIAMIVIGTILLVVRAFAFLVNMLISRQAEYRADAAAVRLTRDPVALAEALYIISRGWRGGGQIPGGIAPLFIMDPERRALDERDGPAADLFSTHPPAEKRVRALLDMARQDLSILESPKKIRMKVLYNKGIMRVSASPAGDRNPGMTCPVCSSPLAEAFYEGAPVHTCSSCGGMLVREDVVPRVLVRDEYDFPEQVRKAAGVIASNRMPDVYKRQAKGANAPFAFNCPVCNGKMKRGFFSSAYPVEVDFCESCGLYWFDKEELETMQCVYELSKHGA